MPRTVPRQFAEAPQATPPAPRIHSLDFSVITATMGGGVEAGKADRLVPYRPTEVRAALRFWWRCSIGSRHANADQLRAAEGAVWGDTQRASRIAIEVADSRLGAEVPAMVKGRPAHYEEPRYALFPAQSDVVRPIYKGGSFKLRFQVPSGLVDDFDAAVRCWIAFGGIGGRTRRGLGALYCSQYNAPSWYNPDDYGPSSAVKPWPQLKGARMVIGTSPMSHQQAWETAVNLMKEFRQKKVGGNPFGRSAWPEPDAIRRTTGQTSPAHSSPVTLNDEFPRSKFGMPIIFHFRTDAHRRGDPDDQTLEPDFRGEAPDSRAEAKDRMASPVILKPLAVSATQSVPVCLVLNTPQPDGLRLKAKMTKSVALVVAGGRDVLSDLLGLAARQWGAKVVQV